MVNNLIVDSDGSDKENLENIKDLVGCVFMDEEGGVVKGSPQYVAEQLGAIFIVNTDFMRGRSWGLYVRGGRIFRDKPTKGIDVCCLRTDGRMEILDGDTLDGKSLLAQGNVWHVLTFGPSLLNGDIDIAKILQIGLPLIGGFLNQRNESVNHSEDFENDDLSAISEIANEEIYSQLKRYFS